MQKSINLLRNIISSQKDSYHVSHIHTSVYWTAVLSLRCGLASTLAAALSPSEENQVENAGRLLPAESKALADLSFSPRILEASIGVAAINSMIPIDESLCLDLNAEAEIRRQGKGRRVGVIGHFPFVKRLLAEAKELWVFELPGRDRTGDLIGDEIKRLLPQAEVVAITSTTLINHTLGSILDNVDPTAYKMMVGPSTPLSPILFDYGFDALSGSLVVDSDQVLTYIGQGANFRQVQGVRKVTMRR
jgi:hypothetical protein